jgi:PTH2 family peptidyl-tRNA hydrolase
VTEKLALVVRTDLDMSRGKIAVQVAHAAVLAVLASQGSSDLSSWLDEGQPKVVLRISGEAELGQLAAAAAAAGLPVETVRDAGRTQLAAGTPTCCAIGPAAAARLDALTGGLALL